MFSFQSIFREPSYFSFSTILSSLLYTVEFAVSNALMLAAMTFSVWFCLSIVTGYGFGYYIFHNKTLITCRNPYKKCSVVCYFNRIMKLIYFALRPNSTKSFPMEERVTFEEPYLLIASAHYYLLHTVGSRSI